jgi:two-component system NtrC family sensor kinase
LNESPPPAAEQGKATSAERALLERPSISIRKRLAFGFLTLFLFCVAVTAAAWFMLYRLEVRLRFLEAADRYTMEIQQARRFEKNYLLYGTNLPDMKEHIENARGYWEKALPDARKLVSAADARRLEEHLARYEALVRRLESEAREGPGGAGRDAAVEGELRQHGSELVAFSMDLAQKERANVNATLTLFLRLPLLFLAVLLVVSFIIANFLARQMLGPLGRLMATTERIAQGDFTPIPPARRFRDEFSNLAIALNTMMRELAHRQEVLVQSHKLQAVGTLTAGVAHELNNPINNITLTAEMLKEDYGRLSDEGRLEMVGDLVTQAERAQKIVKNLLDFARESEIRTELLDVAQLLRGTASLAANQIKLSGAKIGLEIPDHLPPVHGDKQALSQVFLNLLLNALDAVGKGGRVTIAAGGAAEPGFVRVDVTDTGHGIPPHVLPNIFDPFFTTKSGGKGTGLGLSVSLGIVRQHGGDIRVESFPGKGSTFTVLLPAAKVPGTGWREDTGPA